MPQDGKPSQVFIYVLYIRMYISTYIHTYLHTYDAAKYERVGNNGKTLTVTGHMMARLLVRLIVHARMADDGIDI